ncbi:unnamed protein product, partial [Rotaria sp. Silwood2]
LKSIVNGLDISTPLHRFLIAEYILPKLLKSHPEYLQEFEITSEDEQICLDYLFILCEN